MAVSATRFKYLDKETNVPTTDFFSVTNSDTLNAAVDNLVLNANIIPVELPPNPIEDTVKEAMLAVKSMLSGDLDVGAKIKETLGDLEDYIPQGLSDAVGKFTGEFKNVFDKISNLKTSSLCDLINMALGISLASIFFNLSADMRKRLAMLVILALANKLCNTKFNDLSNPQNLINVNELKTAGKSVFSNLVKPNTLATIDKYLPKGSNPIMSVVNNIRKAPNPIAKTTTSYSNPGLATYA